MSSDNPHAPMGWPDPSAIVPADPSATVLKLIETIQRMTQVHAKKCQENAEMLVVAVAALQRIAGGGERYDSASHLMQIARDTLTAIAKAEGKS